MTPSARDGSGATAARTSPAGDGAAEVAIIGLGAIGGSAALRLAERGTRLATWAANARDRDDARAAGIAVSETLDDAVRDAGLILLAVPLDAMSTVVTQAIAAAPPTATLLHAGSLQSASGRRAANQDMDRVIGTHPMAGSHASGFGAARATLFRGATVFVERRAGARQRADAELFWSLAGATRIEYVDAAEHDAAMAWISHLPQLVATALAATLAEHDARRAGTTPAAFAPPAGPGARDTTRLAMSDWAMWRPILAAAPPSTTDALRALEQTVADIRRALDEGDADRIAPIWNRARGWREQADRDATPS